MKKKYLSILAIATLAVLSCKKEDPAVPADPGTATIQGTLYAPLDLSNDTTSSGVFQAGLHNETAVSGVLVTAIVDTEDLQKNPQAGFNYEKLKFTTTIGSDGTFKFTNIPAYSDEISVELRFNDFEATQKQFDPTNNPDETKVFSLTDKNVNVYDGAIVIKEYAYDAN